jgi:hypothetical protein
MLRTGGYPVASVVRWRLPTLSWLGAGLQSDSLVRGSAIALSLLAWSLALVALRELALLDRVILAGSLAGVAVWPFIGESQYTYELWAGLLISVSASLSTMGRHRLAPAFGIAALAVRELSLPYCLCAAAMAWWCGRRFEWRMWLAGLVAWALFYLWHSWQVHLHVSPAEWAASDSVRPWLSLGGLEFVLRTARMNALLIFLPGSVAYVVLIAALLGLAAMRGDTGWMLLASLVSFLTAFFVVGQEFNGYWGVVYAPLLPVGLAHTRQALSSLWAQHHQP